MILYGVVTYDQATEWTTNINDAKKLVTNAIRLTEDDLVPDSDDYVKLVKIDLEEFVVTKYDCETDLNDQLHDEAELMKEYRWQSDDEDRFAILEVKE